MGRSNRLSEQGLIKAQCAFKIKGCTQDYLAGAAGCARQTVINFFAKRHIDNTYFKKICDQLDLKLQDVVDFESEKLSKSSMSSTEEKSTENIQKQTNSLESTEEDTTRKCRATFVLTGTIDTIDEKFLKALVAHLRNISKDAFLTIVEVEEGSIKITLEGSSEGLKRLKELFESGELNDVLGIPVEDVLLATITRETKKVQTTLLLAGDIGGTKTILRLVETSDSPSLHTIYQESFHSGDFPDLVPIVQEFLVNANAPIPEKACFAIAGPVVKNTAKLTNLAWFLDTERLEQELGIPHVSLINDFAAVGYGILGLEKDDLYPLQVGNFADDAPIGIIGAGTGLGQGFLIKQGNYYQVFPSEGGHTDFAPRNELEFQLLKYLLDKHDIQRVSVERVVSGMGIVAIYQFLRDRKFATESPDIAQIVRTWEQEAGQEEKSVDPGAVIGTAALQKRDRLCEQTLQLFIDAYGAEAGNLALKLLPYGGLYIAGGIAPKILPLIQNSGFLLNFTQKGRMRPLLEEIPVYIILNSQVGLIGAALCAARL